MNVIVELNEWEDVSQVVKDTEANRRKFEEDYKLPAGILDRDDADGEYFTARTGSEFTGYRIILCKVYPVVQL